MSSQMRRCEAGKSGEVKKWTSRQIAFFGLIYLFASGLLSACASPQVEAFSPTAIPTLAPATMAPGGLQAEATPELIIESFPAGLPSAANGQEIYAQHCVECHGVDGNGQVPNARNFGDVDYLRGETPLDFYLAITEGVANIEDSENEMPAFGDQLTSDERWDLAYYVWSFGTTSERLAIGNELYTSFCEECHGQDGRSQILNAADLSDQRFIAQLSPSDLYLAVTRGRGSMPAWQARLSQDERWMAVEYLRTFSYDPEIEEATTIVDEGSSEEEEQALCAAGDQGNPFGWDDSQAIAAGEAIYSVECVDCHAEDGTGSIARTRDFTNPAVHGGLIDQPGEALCTVLEGINRMPSFKDTLSETEIWQAITYIASLGE